MKKTNWFRNSNLFFGLNEISCHKIRLQQIIGTGTFKKLLTAKLIAALLLPMFWLTMPQPISAQVSPATAGIPVNIPQSPPPTAFVIPSSNMFSNLFSRSDSLSNEENRFENFLKVFRTPELPAGLESGRVPNLAERLLATIDSSSSILKISPVKSENPKRSENTITDDPADSSEEKSVTQTDEIIAADIENQSGSIEPSALPPTGTTSFDFDGDGKADIARWQPSNGEWKIRNSSAGQISTQLLGASGNQLVPADYDGDGKTDMAVFNPSTGNWSIKKSSDNTTQTISGFGQSGDRAVSAKYDGDAYADVAVYRNGVWLVKQSSTGNVVSISFGTTGDIPVVGNYDGDALADYAVYRPSTGDWHVLGSSAGYFSAHWGIASDIPVPADYDGDGKTDFAVYRGITGSWFIYKSSTNDGSFITQNWGNYGDQPVPADYDGDGKADISIWRPTTGVWYSIKSADNSYDYKTLGVTGDTAVVSAYLKQIGSQVIPYDLAKARLSPKNATGGTDLYSRNFGWSSGLVGLSGRAGMDAGFGISYNSLVWTKQGSTMVFDADNSNVSPGFRFGFPTIEPAYYDSQTGKFAYLMVSPSGARTEFRQISASNKYETADSSYTQLSVKGGEDANTPVEDLNITVTGTSGTKMLFKWIAGAYRCEQIKDRNGNFITINHDEQGLLRTVTDTLGRVINVNYDNQLYPTSITQTWKSNNGAGSNVTHTWATFVYKNHTMNPSFDSSMTVFGPGNNTVIKVLDKLVYGVGATSTDNTGETRFDYNDFGQVWKIRNIAPDSSSHVLNYVRTNLESPSANQTDCPRLSETRNWVENFNQDQNGTAQEIVVANSIQTGQSYSVGGHSGTATKIEVSMQNHPHGAVSKSFVGESGWMESLPIASEDWANGTNGTERKRWTWTNWTQDDPNAAEILNPRVIESKVGDTTNIKRTATEYRTYPNTTISEYGLVDKVFIYDADQTTILKQVENDYVFDNSYISRRIIGLPAKTEVYGLETNGLNLVSKITYAYDEENFQQESNQTIAPIQHDATNFGASFITGRGNITSTTRWNTEFPTNQSEAVTSKIRYDIAGSPVAAIDPLNRKVRTEYADAFNDNLNRNTFAYPTKLIDPANSFSTVKYRFDTGANVFAKSPAPQGNTAGKETARLYDTIGRIERETVLNTGAYTRYEYPANQIQSKTFSTITDTNNNGADASDEVMSEAWTDGAGRTLRARTEHPNSTGGWSGTLAEYDILGQVKRSSVTTEINSDYEPTGDDATRGWLWRSSEYDWMGRTIREINTDGTDKLMSYDGCGCAGGLVTTIQSELVPRDDEPTVNARRTQKMYADILGRNFKAEKLNWDGTTYSTNLITYNGRDQAVNVIEQDNTKNPVVSQTTILTYDGHGRVKTRHLPYQSNSTVTAYNYRMDDSIETVTDARGASVNYSYNSRGLVEEISYAVPQNSNIPVTPTVEFTYDALGNRTQMTDGLGNVSYEYNQLSQMTAETRQFTDALPDAPLSNNRYKLEYGYNLSGQIKFLKDPFGQQFNYTFDKAGRLASVTGSTAFEGITDYAHNPAYNARGLLTKLEYGNGTEMAITGFNNKLQATGLEVKKGTAYHIKKQYQFFGDGSLKFIDDEISEAFDRSYKYDFLGRTTEAKAGKAARGETSTDQHKFDQPYSIAYQHDAFGHIKQINAHHYAHYNSTDYNYENGRNSAWNYDAEGNVLSDLDGVYKYDAAGKTVSTTATDVDDPNELLQPTTSHFDGDGQLLLRVKTFNTNPVSTQKNYYIRSSILNKVISETEQTGKKKKTFVPANGTTLAEQTIFYYTNTPNEQIKFIHQDASGTGVQTSENDGTVLTGQARAGEYDPLGRNIADAGLYVILYTDPPQGETGGSGIDMFGSGEGYRPGRSTYTINGMPASEREFMAEVNTGRIGGAFGLLEIATRMSAQPPRKIGYWRRTETWSENQGLNNYARETNIGDVYADNNSWEIGRLFSSNSFFIQKQTHQKTQIGEGVPENIRSLVSELSERPECKKILEKFIDKLSLFGPILKADNGKTLIETAFDSMEKIVINDKRAGSGATTDGDNIYLRTVKNSNQTFVNGYYAKYVIQELVHNFRKKGQFDDKTLDKVALVLLNEIDPAKEKEAIESKKNKEFTDGNIAHQLLRSICQYTQKEVDENGKTK